MEGILAGMGIIIVFAIIALIIFPILLGGALLLAMIGIIILAIGVAAHHLLKPTPKISNRNPKIKIKEAK
jgi:membrane-associated protease RseP (regulator of RpoE activity)